MKPNDLILTSILKCSRQDLILNPPTLTEEQQQLFDAMVARVQAGEPLQYVLGEAPFLDFMVKVDKRVLIPRPETEILADYVIRHLDRVKRAERSQHKRSLGSAQDDESILALDIGTGSGVLAIALAKAGINVTAIDISQDAIDVAKENAQINGVKIDFQQADIFKWQLCHPGIAKQYPGAQIDPGSEAGMISKFDLIVSNPPYIKKADVATLPQDVQQEPHGALDGGADGLDFYHHIIRESKQWLKPEGYLVMEFGDGQEHSIEEMLVASGYQLEAIIPDYVGTKRIVSATIRV